MLELALALKVSSIHMFDTRGLESALAHIILHNRDALFDRNLAEGHVETSCRRQATINDT